MTEPMTSRESAQVIVNLESAEFDYNRWDYYNDLDILMSVYDQLLKDCDPRPRNRSYQQTASG